MPLIQILYSKIYNSKEVFSFKIFLSGILALFISYYFQIGSPFWSILTVYILALAYTEQIYAKSLLAILATIFGIVISLFIASQASNQISELFYISGFVFLGAFFSASDRHFTWYFYLLAGLSVLIITLPPIVTPQGVFDRAITRIEDILIASFAIIFVDALIFPRRIKKPLKLKAKNWIHKLQLYSTATLLCEKNSIQSSQLISELSAMTDLLDSNRFLGGGDFTNKTKYKMIPMLEAGSLLLLILKKIQSISETENYQQNKTARFLLVNWINSGCPKDNAYQIRKELSKHKKIFSNYLEFHYLVLIYAFWRKIKQSPSSEKKNYSFWPIPRTLAQVYLERALSNSVTVLFYFILSALIWSLAAWDQSTGFAFLMGGIYIALFTALVESFLWRLLLIKLLRFLVIVTVIGFFYVVYIFPSISSFVLLAVVLFPPLFLFGLMVLKPGGIAFVIVVFAIYRLGFTPMAIDINSYLTDTITLFTMLSFVYLSIVINNALFKDCNSFILKKEYQDFNNIFLKNKINTLVIRRSLERYLILEQYKSTQHATDKEIERSIDYCFLLQNINYLLRVKNNKKYRLNPLIIKVWNNLENLNFKKLDSCKENIEVIKHLIDEEVFESNFELLLYSRLNDLYKLLKKRSEGFYG